MPRYLIFFYELEIPGRKLPQEFGVLARTRAQADKSARRIARYLPLKTKLHFDRYMDKNIAAEYLQ